MAKMWAGRFSKEVDENVNAFNSSISFDGRMFAHDIKGSIAHATMLGECGIISKEDSLLIIDGLKGILKDIQDGSLQLDMSAEDIHMFIEAELTTRLGDVGKRLHTSRSRNDQVALDIRLYLRDEIDEISKLVQSLITTLCDIAEQHTDTVMPGYTHLQRAQPITFGHHLMAYAQMFLRDLDRLKDTFKRMNFCPLGSGALAGTTYKINRQMTSDLLGFTAPMENSLDGVSDRDSCIELANTIAIIMMHLSRISEEVIMWCSWEFKFVELDDAYSTGSSIMPQKKNPDMAELIRGKSGRVYGNLIGLLTVMKSLPLAYNKDLQEDKEGMFDTVETITVAIDILAGMLNTMTVNDKHMAESTEKDFSNATELADYLASKGLPFREAHEIVGKLVLECTKAGYYLQDVPLERYQEVSDLIEEDIYETLKSHTAVERRHSLGGTGFDQVKWQIKEAQKALKK